MISSQLTLSFFFFKIIDGVRSFCTKHATFFTTVLCSLIPGHLYGDNCDGVEERIFLCFIVKPTLEAAQSAVLQIKTKKSANIFPYFFMMMLGKEYKI